MINTLQKNKVAEEARLEKLKSGKAPSDKEIVDEVGVRMHGHVPGDPFFSPMKVAPHSITNSKEWDSAFGKLGKDLECLFEANVMLNEGLIRNEERSNVEKTILESKLDKVSLKFEEIKSILEKKSSLQSKHETLKDLRMIDMSSTADIDLKEHNVTLQKLNSSKSHSFGRSKASITPKTQHYTEESFGDDGSMLRDFYNEYTIRKYTVKENSPFSVEIKVTMESPTAINTISMDFSSVSGMEGRLSVSAGEDKFSEIYSMSGKKRLEWSFRETRVKEFKILLTKKEADGYNEGMYEHYFVIRNVSARRNVYGNEATLLCRPMRFDGAVDKVTLKADDMLFNNTNIIYYVGVDSASGHTHWNMAENNETLSLDILSADSKILNRTMASYGEDVGDGCHRVFKLPKNTNVNSIELYPGYQMWFHETIEKVGGYNYKASLESYNINNRIAKDFVDTEDYTVTVESQKLHVFTQHVYCENEQTVTFGSAEVSGHSELFQQIIYCNGTKVACKNDSYTVSMKKGKNKVLMLVYMGTDSDGESHSANVTLKVNFKSVTDDVFAFPKMRYVNPYSLKNESLDDNYIYFSVEDDFILVKHLPNEPNADYNNEMKYFVSYRYLNDKSQYLRQGAAGPYIMIRLKALLLSSDRNFSPKILNYQLSTE